MPIFVPPQKPVREEVKPVHVTKEPYKGLPVDAQKTAVSQLLVYIEGSSWTVTYYRQLVTNDGELSAQQPGRAPIEQQYQVINGFELKVTSPLTSSFEGETGESKLSGGATIYPSFRPNKGDMFIADIGDGRIAVFSVESVEQKNVLRDTTYAIEYNVVNYLNDELKLDLERKTVKTTYFHRDFVVAGQNPIVVDTEHERILVMTKAIEDLRERYMNFCYSHESKTFLVPRQDEPTYDPYVMDALDYWFPYQKQPASRRVKHYATGGQDGFQVNTLWESLIRGDAVLLDQAVHECDTISVKSIPALNYFRGIRFSPLERVLYPKERDLVLYGRAYPVEHARLISPYSQPEREAIELAYAIRNSILNGTGDIPPDQITIPMIHPVGCDDYYVLSERFYTKSTYGQSHLELQTWKYLDKQEMQSDILVQLINDVKNWGPMECFYYIPVLVLLLNAAIKRV